MDLQKLAVKVFVAEPSKVPLTDFIDLFHSWIQATDGFYYDVADYSHMQAGPGVVLVAKDANVSIDEADNRCGLLFAQKGRLSGSNQKKLRTVLQSALENCRRLEKEPMLRGKLEFVGNEALISINDRLIAPNTDMCFEQIKPEIESVASTLFGSAPLTLEGDGDRRRRLSFRIKASRSFGVEELLLNLQSH